MIFMVLTLTLTTLLFGALTEQIMTDVLRHSFVLPKLKTSRLMMPNVKWKNWNWLARVQGVAQLNSTRSQTPRTTHESAGSPMKRWIATCCRQRWSTATLLVASLPLFVKFNSGATARVTE